MSSDISFRAIPSSAEVLVRIPPNLRSLTDGQEEVNIEGSTVREAFAALERQCPGLHDRIFDPAGRVRRFVLQALNDEFLDSEEGLETELRAGDQISILPALAGG